MSSTDWEDRDEADAERVDPEDLGKAPPGSADEESGADGGSDLGEGGAVPREGNVAGGTDWTSGTTSDVPSADEEETL
jgi:hypothetical protein